MWKTIALCASLFGCAALGLAVAAQWLAPGAGPAAAAAGMCVVGLVLILLAPARAGDAARAAPPGSGRLLRPALAQPASTAEGPRLELPAAAAAEAIRDGDEVDVI